MNAVKDQVTKLVEIELAAANEKYPAFHSAHEGYAVMLEEVEEAAHEQRILGLHMVGLWDAIKCDYGTAAVSHMRGVAERLCVRAVRFGEDDRQ